MRDALLTLEARRALARLERRYGPIIDRYPEHAQAVLTRLCRKWGAL